jgi:hypothetical protein
MGRIHAMGCVWKSAIQESTPMDGSACLVRKAAKDVPKMSALSVKMACSHSTTRVSLVQSTEVVVEKVMNVMFVIRGTMHIEGDAYPPVPTTPSNQGLSAKRAVISSARLAPMTSARSES